MARDHAAPTFTVRELQERGILLVEDGNHGEYRPRPDEFVAEGVAFIRAADMDDGRVLFGRASKINDVARARIRKGVGAPGDVLLSHKGTVGKVALVPQDAPAFLCSPQTTFWRTLDEDQIDRGFLFAYLKSDVFQGQLAALKGETDMADYVSLTTQRGLKVPLPPIRVQRDIAAVLGALDDKIELNRRMNETLEAMARMVFKSWFVDFDPVRAKAEGRAPAGMDAATAALFPDGFEESELGKVPRGWRVAPYAGGLSVMKGKSYKSDELQSSRTALVTLKSFLRGGGYREDGLKEYVGEFKPEQVVLPGEVIVAFTDVTQAAEVIGRPARVRADARYSTLVASLDVGIVRPTARELPPEYLYYCFLEPSFTDHTYAHANGSTVLHLAAGAVEKYEGLWPDAKVASAFVEFVRPLLQRQDANWAECDTLANLRDTLLPKLLSGEIRVREAEAAAVRAV